jgi:hypothetical protein
MSRMINSISRMSHCHSCRDLIKNTVSETSVIISHQFMAEPRTTPAMTVFVPRRVRVQRGTVAETSTSFSLFAMSLCREKWRKIG